MHWRACLTVTILFWSTEIADAWAPAGHKITASMAFRLVTADRQREITDILRRHPRFTQDFEAKLPDDLPPENIDEWIWQQASVWPDLCRAFPEEVKAIYHHGTWHYCNRPLFLTAADQAAMESRLTVNLNRDVPRNPAARETMNILQALQAVNRQAWDSREKPADRAVAMCWLFHLTGDIHQPLHAVSMFSEKLFPSLLEGDRGGNSVPTKQGGQLHGLWDSFPGGDIKYRTARQRALMWTNDDEYRQPALEATREMSFLNWFDESHELAREFGYTAEVTTFLKQLHPELAPADRPKLVLSDEYLKTGGLVARQRVVTAGFRLGKLLRD